MKLTDSLLRDIGFFINHLFSPDTFAIVTALGGIAWRVVINIKKKTDEDRKVWLASITEQIGSIKVSIKQNAETADEAYHDLQKEILRLQLLDGMDANRLSPSEAQYFYDKYKNMGGNSFVTAKVADYIERKEKEAEE